jgi:hypothetical protein
VRLVVTTVTQPTKFATSSVTRRTACKLTSKHSPLHTQPPSTSHHSCCCCLAQPVNSAHNTLKVQAAEHPTALSQEVLSQCAVLPCARSLVNPPVWGQHCGQVCHQEKLLVKLLCLALCAVDLLQQHTCAECHGHAQSPTMQYL